MKKTEQLIVVEDFLSVKGIALEAFYAIRIETFEITLQGDFDNGITKALKDIMSLSVTDNGHIAGEINVPVENSEVSVRLRIVLS